MPSIYNTKVLSLMPTWQCTASCNDCGTYSNPYIKTRLENADIIAAIENAKTAGFTLVVFTGGEATLRWQDLVSGIVHANHLGISTRLVTNAWWATSDLLSYQKLMQLKEAGLDEINFSTGDEHARFVPIQNVFRASASSIELGFLPHVMIEVRTNAQITKTSIINSAEFCEILNDKADKVAFCESPWMPMDPSVEGDYPAGMKSNRENLGKRTGCDSIFGTLTLQANGIIGACCGLGMQKIPELQLGKFDRDSTSFAELALNAENDLIKLLIRQFGPEKLLSKVEAIEPSIKWEDMYAHKCQACVRVFSDKAVIDVISKNEDRFLTDLAVSVAMEKCLQNEVKLKASHF